MEKEQSLKMQNKTIAISTAKCNCIDHLKNITGVNRSNFFRIALREYLDHLKEDSKNKK